MILLQENLQGTWACHQRHNGAAWANPEVCTFVGPPLP